MKASSADIHNILRKTELRTLLRSKNRLFSTQGNGTQRSTQRKHENGQGRNLTVVIPIKPLGNLAVILMQQNEQNGQKYKGFANR